MVKLTLRKLTDDDYPTLAAWWKWHRFPAPAKELLPDDGRGGLLLLVDDIPVCAGYIFFTNSKFAWIEFIVSNPEYRENDRAVLLQHLINELTEIAKSKGYLVAYTSLKKESLIEHYEACGYSKGSTGTVEMIKVLYSTAT